MTNDLDLASLLASRLCHDVVGPVGAIQNGLELIAEDKSMTEMAMELIRKSAAQASAKLQFARIAYGAAGGATVLDGAEAGRLTESLFDGERATLAWAYTDPNAPRATVKIAMLLAVYALSAVPRGGEVSVRDDDGTLTVVASSDHLREPPFLDLIQHGGSAEDPRSVMAVLVERLAAAEGQRIAVASSSEGMTFTLEGSSA